MSLSSHGSLLSLFFGDLYPSTLSSWLFNLRIDHNWQSVGHDLGVVTKRTTMPRSTRLIREVGLRRFPHCYAVARILLRDMIVSHIVILCSRTNDRTTREAIALTRSTFTWWWTLQEVHQMGVW